MTKRVDPTWASDPVETLVQSWKPVPGWQMVAASGGFGLLFILLMTDVDGFLFVVDHANLVFHEAGHVIFGILGGTLGQLAIPLIVGATFWKQRDAVSTAIAGVWFFQNFLNIARYMADARAQLLPLVGGGDHDWTNIFSRWGALASDTAIANVVAAGGWIGMTFVWGWLGFMLRRKPPPDPGLILPAIGRGVVQ